MGGNLRKTKLTSLGSIGGGTLSLRCGIPLLVDGDLMNRLIVLPLHLSFSTRLCASPCSYKDSHMPFLSNVFDIFSEWNARGNHSRNTANHGDVLRSHRGTVSDRYASAASFCHAFAHMCYIEFQPTYALALFVRFPGM